MGNLIKKSTELEIPQAVKMMVYGQAGMGKSTFALSAPDPLLLDFDGGAKRVRSEHLEGVGIVPITSWSEVQQLFTNDRADVAPFKTIVIDTVGKMMDYIIAHCCGTRQPQIRDWSKINAEFAWLTRTLNMLNKHIVFVAHRDTRKEGDDNVFIPSLREKSYNAIVTELDLLGYLEMKLEHGKQVRTITFDPTSRNDGKNTCSLPSIMTIPTLTAETPNDFVTTQIIARYHAMLQDKQEQQIHYKELIQRIKDDVAIIIDAATANEFVKKVNSYKHIGSSKAMARQLFAVKLNELGLKSNGKEIVNA